MARVSGAAAAEAALMRALYDEHAAVLWRYALRLTGDAAQAEDVVQESARCGSLCRNWELLDDGRAHSHGCRLRIREGDRREMT